MSNSNLILGYDPKCKLYKREQTKGRIMWYISYYLPNTKRVQRPIHHNLKEAKKILRLKELQLIQNNFDSKDLLKLENFLPKKEKPKRLTIENGLQLYFEVTESRKTKNTHYNDKNAITRYFDFFRRSGKKFLDEISFLDVQLLIRSLDKSSKSEATIKNAVTMVKKVYNCLIDELKLLKCEKPVSTKISLPKKNGLVRNRLASDVEISALLNTRDLNLKSIHSVSPLKEIVSFILFTGARLSEVLHAEWSDFDLDNGIWKIRIKPSCPTRFKVGWAPKWNKARDVVLFTEVIDLLRSLNKVSSFGNVPVRDNNGTIVNHETYSANFVFPKKEIVKLENGDREIQYSRVDSVKTAWKSLKKRAGVTNLQIKDLRTYFNYKLKTYYGFSSKEAGSYIGNSKEVNDLHYTPISQEVIRHKMNLFPLGKVIGSPVDKELLN